MHYFILPTKDLLKLFFFFMQESYSMQNTRGNRKKKNCLEIMLSAYARTSQAKILHLDQNTAKCTTFKWLYGKF